MCECVSKHALALMRQGDILIPVKRIARHHTQDGQEDTACTHTHTCTHLCFEILQYRGQGKQNTSPLHKYTHTTCWQGFAAKFIMSAISHFSPKPCFFSQNYCTDRHCGFNLSTGRVVRERGKYKSLILSHKMYMCTHDFNAHWQTGHICHLHTHALTQTIHNIKCFKKYR